MPWFQSKLYAQSNTGELSTIPQWARVAHQLAMTANPGAAISRPPLTPVDNPRFIFDTAADPSGRQANFRSHPGLASANPFFQPLGTNGRTCLTCHEQSTGWTITPASVQARFDATQGDDPIFRLVDGATCPSDDVSTLAAKSKAYALLLSKGLIRIFLPLPAKAEYKITAVDDPYGCTDLSSGVVSVYRRPLPATNLPSLKTIMWDGREPSLASQAVDATLVHAQANNPPTVDQAQNIVALESANFTAQGLDINAGPLQAQDAHGGPQALFAQLLQPPGALGFSIFEPWLSLTGTDPRSAAQESIARGEQIFNTFKFTINNVGGLNPNGPPVLGGCTSCHFRTNVGDQTSVFPFDTGVTAASLRTLDMPLFTVQCVSGALAGTTFQTTDPGRALITGLCADMSGLKVPVLRALAGRAPFFVGGQAATLLDVVNFYDQRFKIGFTAQQKQDLVNFLQAL